jgi:hypothetical protein
VQLRRRAELWNKSFTIRPNNNGIISLLVFFLLIFKSWIYTVWLAFKNFLYTYCAYTQWDNYVLCVHISVLSFECTWWNLFLPTCTAISAKCYYHYKIKCILFVALLRVVFNSLRDVQCVYYLMTLFINAFKRAMFCVDVFYAPCEC